MAEPAPGTCSKVDCLTLLRRVRVGRLAFTALLISSHVMDEAARCDRVLLVREGRLVADDTPEQLMDRTGARDVESAFLALAVRSLQVAS
jgi:ABC-type multidrug transport system ATPase subunit